jgi:hypothetical protein
MDVPDENLCDKLWVTRFLVTTSPLSVMVSWRTMPHGEQLNPGIRTALQIGRGMAKPDLTSFMASLWKTSGSNLVDLLLPNASASCRSCRRSVSERLSIGKSTPTVRARRTRCHNGCRPRTVSSTSAGLNSEPGDVVQPCSAARHFSRLRSYDSKIRQLWASALAEVLKMNLDLEGVGHL